MKSIKYYIIPKNIELFFLIKWYILTFTFFIIAYSNLTGFFPFWPSLYLILLFEAFSNILLSRAIVKNEKYLNILFLQLTFDYILVFFISYFFARLAPWLSFLAFSFFILLSGILFESSLIFVIALLSAINITVIQIFDALNLYLFYVKPIGERIMHRNTYYILNAISGTFFFFLFGLIIDFLSKSLPRSEREIIKERHQLRSTLESLGDGVMVTDSEGRVVQANKGAEELFETRRSKLLEKMFFSDATIFKNTLDFNEGNPREWLERVLSEGKHIEGRFKIIMPLEEKIIKVTLSPVREGSEKPSGAVIVFDDLTKVQRLENIKSDFISTLSHELRTPLTSIKGYVSLLLHPKGKFDNQTKNEYMLTINRQTDRLIRLIDDLLDVSRIEAGKIELKKQLVNIKSLTEKVIVNLNHKTKIHSFKIIFPNDISDVYIDPDRL
ncbi:MAG: PAS domain-containing protein, partial [Actinomycetia bacterium]|nr:PAS domain-containing protein [Actinomycetes bacterium]